MCIDILKNELFLSKVIFINAYSSFWDSLHYMRAHNFYHTETRISGFYVLHKCGCEKTVLKLL